MQSAFIGLKGGITMSSTNWGRYVEQHRKVMLFTSDYEGKERLRQEVDARYPKADVVVVASLDQIITGQKCGGYVMVRAA